MVSRGRGDTRGEETSEKLFISTTKSLVFQTKSALRHPLLLFCLPLARTGVCQR